MRFFGSIERLLGAEDTRRTTALSKRAQMVSAALAGGQTLNIGGGDHIPCPGAELLPMSQEAIDLGLGYPSLALPPAQMYVFDNARVCPGSRVVMTRDSRVVAESIRADMIGRVKLLNSEVNGEPLRMEGSIALYQSPRSEPFHGLIDHLPRAALFAQPLVRRLGNVTLVHEGPLSDVDEMWLQRLAGPAVKVLRVEAGTPLTADRVFLPGYVTRPYSGAIPTWYRKWIDKAAASIPAVAPGANGSRRYFVDRIGGGRKVLNRTELDEVLDKYRVTAMAPSSLEVQERVATFRDAELVIGVTGSGMSNLVFSKNAQVIELLPGSRLFPHSYYLSRSRGLPYQYVKAPKDNLGLDEIQRLTHDVVVDVEALEAILSKLDEKTDANVPNLGSAVA